MRSLSQRTTSRLVLAAVLSLIAIVLTVAPLPALPAVAQDDEQPQEWVEVHVGQQNTVFVPAICVSGIEFQTGLTQEQADQVELPGFLQATITCDTAIYDAPGGNVIQGSSLTAGSVWFVNPVIWYLNDVSDQMGQSDTTAVAQPQVQTQAQSQRNITNRQAWIELQLTSVGPLVYIPATCVQGLPSFGLITWQNSRSESVDLAREAQTPQQIEQAQQQMEQVTGQQAQTGQFDWGHNFLVTLLCNTPVYDSPGGNALEAIQLNAGQTWFAAPYLWLAPTGTAQPLTGGLSGESQADAEQSTPTPEPTLQPTTQPGS